MPSMGNLALSRHKVGSVPTKLSVAMPDILQFTSTRQIEPLPAHTTLAKAIFTHLTPDKETLHRAGLTLSPAQVDGQILPISVSDLLDKFVKDPAKGWKPGGAFYNSLLEPYRTCNVDKIVALALEYMEQRGARSARDLKPQTQVAAEYFRHSNPNLINAHLESFVKGVPDIDTYLKKGVDEELRLVADSLLAVRVLGLPPTYEAELIHLLRTVLTLYYLGVHAQSVLSKDQDFPLAWLVELWRLPVLLPHWSFDVKPCGCKIRKKTPRDMSRTDTLKRELDLYESKLAAINSTSPINAASPVNPASAKADVRQGDATPVVATPSDDLCNCCEDCDPPCMPQNPCCADIDLFVTDYFVLRDETYCYKPGDLAYIEVVAAGEKRTRIHSTKTITEDFSETESTTSKKEERDHQVTEKSSLQSEINKQIEKSLDVKASADWGTYKLESSGKLSRSDSEKVAREMTKEMVEKAVLSLQEDIRVKQSRKVTKEVSESNKHTFKNVGTVPLVTKYFWVTQQKKAQVFSYGKRATAELIIPSPAMLYEKLLDLKRLKEFGKKPPRWKRDHVDASGMPIFADANGIVIKPAGINEANASALGDLYGVDDLPGLLPETTSVSVLSDGREKKTGNFPVEVVIPEGYEAVSFKAVGTYHPQTPNLPEDYDPIHGKLNWNFEGYGLFYREHTTGKFFISFGTPVGAGSYTCATVAQDMNGWSATLIFDCNRTAAALSTWKGDVYAKLRAAHDADVAAYMQEVAEYEAELAEFNRQFYLRYRNRNPFFNREIERAELKRAAIYLMCEKFARKGPMNMKSEPCGYPEMDRELAQELGYDWYFWDRAFDWDLMSYIFLDYFWNPMCTWPDKFDPDDPDALFKAFRRAGYSRVMVPVAEGMEDDVEYYLATGQKWGQTGIPPKSPSDSRWRDLVTEIKHQRHCRQTDREGVIDCFITTTQKRVVTIKGSDRYRDPANPSHPSKVAVDLDIDREIYIDLAVYRIAGIAKSSDSSAPPYNPSNPDQMWWEITLERDFEGDATKQHKYAVGAKFIGAPFLFELPTELVWAGAHGDCLPCYPILCKDEPTGE